MNGICVNRGSLMLYTARLSGCQYYIFFSMCLMSNPVPCSLYPELSHYRHVVTKCNVSLKNIRTGEVREVKSWMKSMEYCYILSPEVKSPILCSYQTYPFHSLSIYTIYDELQNLGCEHMSRSTGSL